MFSTQSNSRLDAKNTISAGYLYPESLPASSKLHEPHRTWIVGTLALFSFVTPFLGVPQAEAKRATKPKRVVVQTPAKLTTNPAAATPAQAKTAVAIAGDPATNVAPLQAAAAAKPLVPAVNQADVDSCQTRSESTSSVDGTENKGDAEKEGNKTDKYKGKDSDKTTTGAKLGEQGSDRNGTNQTTGTVEGTESKDKDSQKSGSGDDSASQNRNQCTVPDRVSPLPIVPVAISAAPSPAATPAPTPNPAAPPQVAPVSIGMSIDAATAGAPLKFTTRIANPGVAARLSVVVNVTGSTLPGYLEAVGPGWSCSGYIKRPAGSASFTCTGSVAAAASSAIVVSSGSKISSAPGSAITATATANPGGIQGTAQATIR
jgi:hypothetical protein